MMGEGAFLAFYEAQLYCEIWVALHRELLKGLKAEQAVLVEQYLCSFEEPSHTHAQMLCGIPFTRNQSSLRAV